MVKLRAGDLVKFRLKGKKESEALKGRIITIDKDKIVIKTKMGSIIECDEDGYLIEKYGRDYVHLANAKMGWIYDEVHHKSSK